MATIKSFTSLEQSKKLAEILPIESADMWWSRCTITDFGDGVLKVSYAVEPCNISQFRNTKEDIPCWSLTALLEQLPYELCDDDGNSSYLQMNKEDDVYQLVYTDPYGDFEAIETDGYEDFVDACVDMIIKLKELNLLKK